MHVDRPRWWSKARIQSWLRGARPTLEKRGWAENQAAGLVLGAETFDLEEWHGRIAPGFKILDLAAEIRRLSDPAAAEETIHWGRNYLYRTHLETTDGRLDVVVKQFRNQGLRQRLRRRWRGSKAARSYDNARAFEAAGLATAEAVLLIESKRSDGPSFFVTRYLSDVIEARYLLRAANQHLEHERFPDIDMDVFLDTLGDTLRRMHEAGFFHRDLSIGNVLVPTRFGEGARGPSTTGSPEGFFVIDLNRARRKRRLSLSQRTRDLCRLTIFRPEQQARFLTAYWGAAGTRGHRVAVYKLYHHGFLFRIEGKKRLREWFRRSWQWLLPRRAHAHIPEAPKDASARDKIVWDYLSDQPHQHASRFEKLRVRLLDAPSHLRQTAAFVAAAPRIMRRYRQLMKNLYQQPTAWGGVGICVRPYPEAPDQLLDALDDLSVNKVLLRLHPWDDDHTEEEALARELAGRGCDLTFALPQNRDLVRDPDRWRMKIEELAERFMPYGKRFQIGQAINRSKWGVWRYGEYLNLASSAAEILRRTPGVEILGPAVIDFEYHVTASILNLRQNAVRFDILSSLLYVDRRGAPEQTQLGFDTVGKVALLKAIAETARHCSSRSWVTEVNWPLWEGPHSPAGRTVSVSPEAQADYLARYYLLALTTGTVERVYWWQLVARGYGLAMPRSGAGPGRHDLLRRPGFLALATLARELRGSRFIRPLPSPSQTYLFLFQQDDGEELIAAWSVSGNSRATLPRPARGITEQDGEHTAAPNGCDVEVSETVRYFHL